MAQTRQRRRLPTVERSIHFYRADSGVDGRGHARQFNIGPALQHLESLSFSQRYLDSGDGEYLCCWIERQAVPQRMLLGTIRRNALPQVERAGRLRPLGIPTSSGLVEQIHIVFFESNIVGAEFNFYGPRLPRLAGYLADRAPGISALDRFEPLLRQDVRDQLARLRNIRLFDIRLRRGYAGVLAQANRDLFAGLEALGTSASADEIEVILRTRPRSRLEVLAQGVLNVARSIAGRDDLRANVSRFQVRGFDPAVGRTELIDVLNDQLIATRSIIKQGARSRALNSGAAFAAIEGAYAELRPQLLNAARM